MFSSDMLKLKLNANQISKSTVKESDNNVIKWKLQNTKQQG